MTTKKKVEPRSTTKADIELGQRIRLRRVEQKVSQTELGTALGVSFQQVQKYEKGTNRVGANRLDQIARALHVPVSFFFDNQGKKEIEVETLLFMDSKFSIRLLRAYRAIGSRRVQHDMVALMERIAGMAVT